MTPHDQKKTNKNFTDNEIDQLLAAIPFEVPSARLRSSVLDLVKTSLTEKDRWWWPFSDLWQPAAVLACSALFGLGLGAAWSPSPAPTPIWEQAAPIVFGPVDEE